MRHTLLLLEAIILVYLGLQKETLGFIFRLDDDFRLFATFCILYNDDIVSYAGPMVHRGEKSAAAIKAERQRDGRAGGKRKPYLGKGRDAEAGTAVEPVTVAEFINLDALLVRGLMRHRLCHHRRLGVALRDDNAIVCYQARGDVEVLLEGEFRRSLVVTQKRERRHGFFLGAPGEGTQ